MQQDKVLKAVLNLVNKFWLTFTGLILLAITVLSLLPLPELPSAPGSDKLHHLLAYAALAIPPTIRRPRGWQLYLIGFALFSGLIEIIQPYVNRYGEWQDLFANVAGLLIGATCAHFVKQIPAKNSLN